MSRRLPLLQWAYIGLTACSACLLALRLLSAAHSSAFRPLLVALFSGAVVISSMSAFLEVAAKRPRTYFLALAVHLCCLLALAPLILDAISSAIVVYGVFLFGACIHNPFPANAVLSSVAGGLFVSLRAYLLAERSVSPFALMLEQLELGISIGLIAAIATVMVRHRERSADLSTENRRLDDIVDRLTRSNLQYLEYAKSVEETSTEGERKRITRDIHDIVGYTLTNTVTMMEAITDTIQENPLGIAHMVTLARDNAQEGLTRVREALRLMRAQENALPVGWPAIQRLVQVFQRATGVKVEFAFSDVAWAFPAELDSALYHLVQECLINSFRHGRATRVRIFLSESATALEVRILDNGVGAAEFKEGIGLSGMRERLARLGGTLVAKPISGGFGVLAKAPKAQP